MIHIKNNQRKITIDLNQMQNDLRIILKALKYADFDISVLITTNRTIRRYNSDFRHKDKATDILSFPYHPELENKVMNLKYSFPHHGWSENIRGKEYYVQLDRQLFWRRVAARLV